MTMKEIFTPSLHRKMALVIVLAGAAGSIGYVLYTGRNNDSIFLSVRNVHAIFFTR